MAIILADKTLKTKIDVSQFAISLQPEMVSLQVAKIETVENEIIRLTPIDQIHVVKEQDPTKFEHYKNLLENGQKETLFTEILVKYQTV